MWTTCSVVNFILACRKRALSFTPGSWICPDFFWAWKSLSAVEKHVVITSVVFSRKVLVGSFMEEERKPCANDCVAKKLTTFSSSGESTIISPAPAAFVCSHKHEIVQGYNVMHLFATHTLLKYSAINKRKRWCNFFAVWPRMALFSPSFVCTKTVPSKYKCYQTRKKSLNNPPWRRDFLALAWRDRRDMPFSVEKKWAQERTVCVGCKRWQV